MSRDWNIVDDEPAEEAPPADDGRLDPHRVRLVTLERRAAHQSRMWNAAAAVLSAIAAATLLVRAGSWMMAGTHKWWAIVAIVLALILFGVADNFLRAMRRSGEDG